MNSVTLHIKITVNELCLGHLIWDALMEETDDAEAACLRGLQLSKADLRELARKRLASHGLNSVDCGPQHAYAHPMDERAFTRKARHAFNLPDPKEKGETK